MAALTHGAADNAAEFTADENFLFSDWSHFLVSN
jgi:hypothetical protein